ncbi:hypothetical protein GGR34_000051 [Microvirga flocculans]|uniref:Uncharacterized protein n=1 Tax=Microvirga flocculans TaxID=217168 RepID=A0A7W6IBL3_9HYPH|nr:hypothetical protein [Microvirga flocculans]MBB4038422.1 hypothetical protein [Microvirga flocculans]
MTTLERSETIKVDDLVSALRSEILPALGWALGRDPVLSEDGQALPPEFVREMDRLGIGTTEVTAGGLNGEPDDSVAEPGASLVISSYQVETGACLTKEADSIVLPTDLIVSVGQPIGPVPGISSPGAW